MALIFLLNKLTSKKSPRQWRNFGPLGPEVVEAWAKRGQKGAHFQAI